MEPLLRELWPPDDWHDVTVLVAVSGGADSVALLRGLHAIRSPGPGRLIVAHFNHQLRREADDDETFVRELATSLGFEGAVGRANRSAAEPRLEAAIEETARSERYEFFREAARQRGARYVATAHTADDQAETVLHRIVRGTGIAGLAGMRRTRPLAEGIALIRPLLTVRRAELAAYLAELGQSFREDATNAERRFTRNRLRNDLLPQLARDYNANVVDALLRLSRLANEAQVIIDTAVADLLRRAVRFDGQRVILDGSQLIGQPRYLVRELLVTVWRQQGWPEQSMGFAEWNILANSILSPEVTCGTLPRMLPGGISVQCQPETVILSRQA
jgi:tRNA(Ile)-lysidine synthase